MEERGKKTANGLCDIAAGAERPFEHGEDVIDLERNPRCSI